MLEEETELLQKAEALEQEANVFREEANLKGREANLDQEIRDAKTQLETAQKRFNKARKKKGVMPKLRHLEGLIHKEHAHRTAKKQLSERCSELQKQLRHAKQDLSREKQKYVSAKRQRIGYAQANPETKQARADRMTILYLPEGIASLQTEKQWHEERHAKAVSSEESSREESASQGEEELEPLGRAVHVLKHGPKSALETEPAKKAPIQERKIDTNEAADEAELPAAHTATRDALCEAHQICKFSSNSRHKVDEHERECVALQELRRKKQLDEEKASLLARLQVCADNADEAGNKADDGAGADKAAGADDGAGADKAARADEAADGAKVAGADEASEADAMPRNAMTPFEDREYSKEYLNALQKLDGDTDETAIDEKKAILNELRELLKCLCMPGTTQVSHKVNETGAKLLRLDLKAIRLQKRWEEFKDGEWPKDRRTRWVVDHKTRRHYLQFGGDPNNSVSPANTFVTQTEQIDPTTQELKKVNIEQLRVIVDRKDCGFGYEREDDGTVVPLTETKALEAAFPERSGVIRGAFLVPAIPPLTPVCQNVNEVLGVEQGCQGPRCPYGTHCMEKYMVGAGSRKSLKPARRIDPLPASSFFGKDVNQRIVKQYLMALGADQKDVSLEQLLAVIRRRHLCIAKWSDSLTYDEALDLGRAQQHCEVDEEAYSKYVQKYFMTFPAEKINWGQMNKGGKDRDKDKSK
jgi:hypothetical protein